MGAFLSIGRGAFFRLVAAGMVGSGSRTAPVLRFLGQREMSVSEALSRPKPPEAGAEGQPLQGFAHRQTIACRDRGAEGMSRPRLPSSRHMRRLLVCADSDGEGRTADARPRSPRRRRSTSWSFWARRGPGPRRVSFGRGLDFPPFLIRSEASLHEAEAEGLHARIRGSSNSRPLCLISRSATARDRGDGTNLDGGVLQP